MEEGALRVDANVSVHEDGQPMGTRTEIKNIGSVRGVAGAVRHEIARQLSLVARGRDVSNQTRAWDAAAGATVPMRDKETVQDYRYMPEPNLPPLRLNLKTKEDTHDVISVPLIKDRIPELPEETRLKLIKQHGLKPEIAIQLVNEPKLTQYFTAITSENTQSKTKVANFLLNDLLTVLNKRKIDVQDCPITVKQLREIVDGLLLKEIDLNVSKMVINDLLDRNANDLSPTEIIKEKGWFLSVDESEIDKLCTEVINSNPKLVKQYKDGKVKVFKALLGIITKSSKNKIDMSIASRKLEELLKK